MLETCGCPVEFLSTPSARRATFPGLVGHLHVLFLSTPSARRATAGSSLEPMNISISIHALREEGDQYGIGFDTADAISIHALREEGDCRFITCSTSAKLFLSTPSARRATAKTETKSLFSNKLYNILHEFRRALIYNGSKSYPNHAK